ncbi:26143_t:CDS:10 [Gigaspora margarita]|uniref:26143_t:CDS:1 n=1 Tax=Gigaspora margarita TaxID=4874 RepID=A0ABN7VID5_GIGMA|nr:26143_t:CDS:10 [Gigaspora margarita]
MRYYLLYGHHGEKNPNQVRKYFREAADESNHAESQCSYAVMQFHCLVILDEIAKNKLRKEIILYFELAANNNDNRNYLRLAANNQNEKYTKSVSKLKGYKRFLHAIDVKNKFKQLRNDFDKCMTDLNFVIDDSNEIDREEESQRVDKSLKEVKESLEQLDDKLDEGFKQADDKLRDDFKHACDKIDAVTQHIDFMQSTKQGDEKNIIDPVDKSTIEIACKHINGQKENEMAILRKLGLSPQILKLYGHSVVNNLQVMILEWVELGNLRELYDKHDVLWTRKIKIAKDILLGLLFLRTVNVFHHDIRDLSVKLGNVGLYGHHTINVQKSRTNIVRWMAPELIKEYSGYVSYENMRGYTFNCEMFSFGMLLWELCYEKVPYAEWNTKQISEHVLSGKRESILKGKFAIPNDCKIQLEFIKIIQDGLKILANKFPILLDVPPLYKNEELDLDGLKSGDSILENDYPEIEEETPKEEIVPVIPLKDVHGNVSNKNTELNNPEAKFWIGYYLLYGHRGEKDPIQARKYFKEAADEHNHSESQCRYAVSLLGDLGKKTDKDAKDKLCKEIIRYFELAANNPKNRIADAMYYLGDIYMGGKLRVKKEEERGLNYLKLVQMLIMKEQLLY